MNIRNTGDLSTALANALTRFPADIDLVVGIPRSGLLAAGLFALYRNLPMTDLEGLLEGRLIGHGARLRDMPVEQVLAGARRILVLDDSINSGQTMHQAREVIANAALPAPVDFGVVYATEQSVGMVDHYCEIVPPPRAFSWNIMHHPLLQRCCVDIDGVLCRDPSPAENDDGEAYLGFLADADPVYLPDHHIGWLVTSRLEKYRKETMGWLARHGVKYGELAMLDLPDKATRQALGAHAAHKARVYRSTDALLFIESEPVQAAEIARLSGRPVFCSQSQTVFDDVSTVASATRAASHYGARLRRRAARAARLLGLRRPGKDPRPGRGVRS